MRRFISPSNLALRYGLLFLCGLLLIAAAWPLGYLARWLPTWLAVSTMSLSVLISGVLISRRVGWTLMWACIVALILGISGAMTGSHERQEAEADELGPVPLSVVEERKDHDSFYLKDVKLGELEYEFTHCGSEDCYDDVLVSIRSTDGAANDPVKYWILASQDSAFNGNYFFSRVSNTYHQTEELQRVCKQRGLNCIDGEQAVFFEPVKPSKERLAERGDRQDARDDEVFVMTILILFLWGGPVLIGLGREWWRRSMGLSG